MDFIKALFSKWTLDDVIRSFKHTLRELDILIAANEQEIASNAETIVVLQQANAELNAENLRAIKVRENITKLIEE